MYVAYNLKKLCMYFNTYLLVYILACFGVFKYNHGRTFFSVHNKNTCDKH